MSTATDRLVPVDPESPHFAALVDVLQQLDIEQLGDAHEPMSPAWHALSWRSYRTHRVGWAALEGDDVVGVAVVKLDETDNTHLADVEIAVRPEARGRGHGHALFEQVLQVARDEGRDTVLGYTGYRPDPEAAWELHDRAVADPGLTTRLEPAVDLGVSFARGTGAELVQTELRSQVRLPSSADLVARVEAEAAAHAVGYTTRAWVGRVPDDLMADRAALAARMSTDAPTAEIDFRPEEWDAEKMSGLYTDWARQGLHMIGAGALDQDGTLVAFSEVARERHTPLVAHQFDTIVDPDHRGRRLGTVVKAANLREVERTAPEVERVITYNALENGPMLRVNRAIGFVPVGLYAVWQLKLS